MANAARTFSVPIVVLQAIAGVAPPQTLQFSGVDLLNAIGRAMTRPDAIDDPDRLFALFRYGTKISNQVPNFRLSSARRIRDIHKGSVLSDEVGAGFAFLFASNVLGTAIFLDLPDAIRRGEIIRPAPKSTVPDYIGLYGPSNSVVILEAKGSQTKNRCRTRQMPKGCEQVASVGLPGGKISTRVVVGIELRRDDVAGDTTMFIGDPPEEKSYPYFQDVRPEELALRQHYKRVAALIGDLPLLRRVEEEGVSEKIPTELVSTKVGSRAAVGSTFQFHTDNGSVGFFVGIDLEVRESLFSSLNPTQGKMPVLEPQRGQAKADDRFSSFSISRDGTVMEIWFQGTALRQVVAQER